jgi:hypothetical protein
MSSANMLMTDLETSKNVRLLTIGENHSTSKELHEYCTSVVPILSNQGFKHLALELSSQVETTVNDFCLGKINPSECKKIICVPGKLTQYLTDSFFEFIKRAYAFGLKINCIGEEEPDREKKLFDAVDCILKVSSPNKVVLLAGVAHTMNRKVAISSSDFKCLTEMIAAKYGSSSIYGIAQMEGENWAWVPQINPRNKLKEITPGFVNLQQMQQVGIDVSSKAGHRIFIGAGTGQAENFPKQKIDASYDSWNGFYWYEYKN